MVYGANPVSWVTISMYGIQPSINYTDKMDEKLLSKTGHSKVERITNFHKTILLFQWSPVGTGICMIPER